MSKYEELKKAMKKARTKCEESINLTEKEFEISFEDLRDANNAANRYGRATAEIHDELVMALENSLKGKGETGAIKSLLERVKAL